MGYIKGTFRKIIFEGSNNYVVDPFRIKETKILYAGGLTATMAGFLLKGLNFFTDLGRFLGSSIKRIYDNNLCDY